MNELSIFVALALFIGLLYQAFGPDKGPYLVLFWMIWEYLNRIL